MRQIHLVLTFFLFIMALAYFLPLPAAAYIGPGAGLSAIGAFLAVVFGVLIALVGFVWYPLKRIIRKIIGRSGS